MNFYGNDLLGTVLFLASFAGVFLVATPGYAQDVPASFITGDTVAVPVWQSYGERAEAQDWLGESLQRLSVDDLTRIGELNVVDTSTYRTTLSEAGLEEANPNDSKNALEIARAVDADLILIGTYQIQHNQIQLSAAFYDPEEGTTVAAHSEMGDLGRIKILETVLMEELLRKAGVALGTVERDWIERDKKLRTTALTFDQPQARPQVIERSGGPESVFEAVGAEEPSGEAERNNLVVGLHWPGFSIGYQPARNTTLEFRAEANSDITVLGGRYNHHFYRFGKSNLYWGVQASHIDFVGEVSEGSGFLGGGFLGFEQYVSENFSVKGDVGTYMVTLEDDDTSVSVSGLGFSMVTGVAFHFW
jgi:TolB-like protein